MKIALSAALERPDAALFQAVDDEIFIDVGNCFHGQPAARFVPGRTGGAESQDRIGEDLGITIGEHTGPAAVADEILEDSLVCVPFFHDGPVVLGRKAAQLAVGDEVFLLTFQVKAHMPAYGRAHAGFDAVHGSQAAAEIVGQIVHGGFQDVEQQVFLAGVMIVDAGFLDAAAAGDVTDAGGKVAFAEKQVDGDGFDNRFHVGHGPPCFG
ncbi:hypothetical protein DESC_720343 [Desulfosarcina cetonica]|nr:hypothetical protein DESC_720343 [Desulfosarcina cetonica]